MKFMDMASYLCMMFGVVLAGLLTWIIYRPAIQGALRAAQDLLFRLQP